MSWGLPLQDTRVAGNDRDLSRHTEAGRTNEPDLGHGRDLVMLSHAKSYAKSRRRKSHRQKKRAGIAGPIRRELQVKQCRGSRRVWADWSTFFLGLSPEVTRRYRHSPEADHLVWGRIPSSFRWQRRLLRRRRIQPPRGRGILAKSILARSGTIPCLSAVPVSSLHQSHIAWSRRGPTRSGDMHRVVNAPCQAGQETVRAVMNRIPCLLDLYIARSVPKNLILFYFQ